MPLKQLHGQVGCECWDALEGGDESLHILLTLVAEGARHQHHTTLGGKPAGHWRSQQGVEGRGY